MNQQKYPMAFLSYAHEDKLFAISLAEELSRNGVDPLIDGWEINAGDSLIEKVFEESLEDCTVFIIILSSESASYLW